MKLFAERSKIVGGVTYMPYHCKACLKCPAKIISYYLAAGEVVGKLYNEKCLSVNFIMYNTGYFKCHASSLNTKVKSTMLYLSFLYARKCM